MKSAFIFPPVRQYNMQEGYFNAQNGLLISADNDALKYITTAFSLYSCECCKISYDKANVVFEKSELLTAQGYEIEISCDKIHIRYCDVAGAFYSAVTLCSIIQDNEHKISCAHIVDAPFLKIRGVLLDVSRGKVPKLKTLKQIADNMAKCKLNHLQLYIEGYSFAYEQYRELWEEETPLTHEEIREFDLYCRDRLIDLVPCQNSLGHMGKWLNQSSLKSLAECENGFSVFGHTFPPTTLDVKDEKSLDFVKGLFNELLDAFSSEYCNCCLDEPFELAAGKNADEKEQKYLLYCNYANKLSAYLKSKNRKMMMWADVLNKDNACIDMLDSNTTILEWGYEKEYPFEERLKALRKKGRKFCVCPGTNSWLSATGITDNMLGCIKNAADAAYKYGAEGLIVTDWGDEGHLQYLPVMWSGILTAAAYAWNKADFNENMLETALNKIIFYDKKNLIGKVLLQAGRYINFEEYRLPCRTLAFAALSKGLVTKEEYEKHMRFYLLSMPYFSPEVICRTYEEEYRNSLAGEKTFDYDGLVKHFESLTKILDNTDMQCMDSSIVKRELRNSFQLVCALSCIRSSIINSSIPPLELVDILGLYKEEHITLWNLRNKSCDCVGSLASVNNLMKTLKIIN